MIVQWSRGKSPGDTFERIDAAQAHLQVGLLFFHTPSWWIACVNRFVICSWR